MTASQTVAAAEACAPGLRGGQLLPRFQFGVARREDHRRRARRARRRPLRRGRGDDGGAAAPAQGAAAARRAARRGRSRRRSTSSASRRGSRARELGVASATKMCRSVLIKGLEAMVIESFIAARRYGVEEALIASLRETFPGVDWDRQAALLLPAGHRARPPPRGGDARGGRHRARGRPRSVERVGRRRTAGLGGRPRRRRRCSARSAAAARAGRPTGATRPTGSSITSRARRQS